jgi:hypothetical protein
MRDKKTKTENGKSFVLVGYKASNSKPVKDKNKPKKIKDRIKIFRDNEFKNMIIKIIFKKDIERNKQKAKK